MSPAPEAAADVVARLRAARPVLLGLKTSGILRAIGATVDEWLRSDSARRSKAEAAFSAATGIPSVTAPFRPLLEECRERRLKRWVKDEVDPVAALDGAVRTSAGRKRAVGPGMIVHVLPGNVPLVWLPGFLAGLLARSPSLLKPAADDPLTPGLFVESLVEKLPALRDGVAVLPWTGGDERVEGEVLDRAETVVAYGGDLAIGSLGRRMKEGTRLIAHGPRLAVGVIAREATAAKDVKRVAAAAARDALLYDGRGCLSLTTVFVESGGRLNAREAAAVLAESMMTTAGELPPGRQNVEVAALTQSWRARVTARQLAGKGAAAFTSPGGLDWTLLYDGELPPPGCPLARTLWVGPLGDLAELPGRLSKFAVGAHAVAYSGSGKRRPDSESLGATGVTRITDFGKLQRPPVSWSPAGESWFRQLLRWDRVEPG